MIDEPRIPQHIAKLTTTQGFIEAFWERLSVFETYEGAYESVERQYIYHFDQRKYKDYDSFRNCMKHFLKKKLQGEKKNI